MNCMRATSRAYASTSSFSTFTSKAFISWSLARCHFSSSNIFGKSLSNSSWVIFSFVASTQRLRNASGNCKPSIFFITAALASSPNLYFVSSAMFASISAFTRARKSASSFTLFSPYTFANNSPSIAAGWWRVMV